VDLKVLARHDDLVHDEAEDPLPGLEVGTGEARSEALDERLGAKDMGFGHLVIGDVGPFGGSGLLGGEDPVVQGLEPGAKCLELKDAALVRVGQAFALAMELL
jgi:hypothetical protein